MILSKEPLNSDSQQFHQYQQNEQPPLTSDHFAQKKSMTYRVGNWGPGLVNAWKCGRVVLRIWQWQLQFYWWHGAIEAGNFSITINTTIPI